MSSLIILGFFDQPCIRFAGFPLGFFVQRAEDPFEPLDLRLGLLQVLFERATKLRRRGLLAIRGRDFVICVSAL
jgi:hypothetical protein